MTKDETYRQIAETEELRERYAGIKDAGALEMFLEELGCRETPEEFMKYVKIKYEGEISKEEAENVAGGFDGRYKPLQPIVVGDFVIQRKR